MKVIVEDWRKASKAKGTASKANASKGTASREVNLQVLSSP